MQRSTAYPPAGIVAIRGLLQRERIGVIYTVPSGRDQGRVATACVHQTRLKSPDADILLDANRYSGSKRKMASEGIDEAWLRRQHRDGLRWALTDSGYIGCGDTSGLAKVLHAAARFQDMAQAKGRGVIASLPLANSWLTEDADKLSDLIEKTGVPAALVLEDEDDPLDKRNAVQGLISVLAGAVPVSVLRCDMSVLGALAYGAAVVSVGDASHMRHFYPLTTDGGGRGPKLATLVPDLLGYFHVSKIEDAITAAPNLEMWICHCGACGGRRLDWIGNSVEPGINAFEHAVSALAEIGRTIFGAGIQPQDRPLQWVRAIYDAQVNHDKVTTTTGQSWTPKDVLGQWISQYTPVPGPSRIPD